MERADLEQLQLERLQSTLNRAYKNVPFYGSRFDALRIDPNSITSVRHITGLPLTTREDLADNYPYGLFAVPLRDIVRISSSSGTTMKPVVVGYTRTDLKERDAITARFLTAGGVVDTDVVQISLNPSLSNWGRALKEGAERIGASVMPMSQMSISKQLMAMEDFRTSVLLTTPSYAMYMLGVIKSVSLDPNSLSLKAILTVGEPLREDTREVLESGFKVNVTSGYGPSDVMGPGVAFECREKKGLHISEDHFVLEIVDPGNGEPVSPGDSGEVVLTTLTAKAFPLVRFRTGDLASLKAGSCPCGRSLNRMSGITGHTGAILTVRGVKVHPAQIERILANISRDSSPRFLIHLYKENHLDMVEILLEMTNTFFSDEVKVLENALRRLRQQMFQNLGLEATIRLVEAATLDDHGLPSGAVMDDR
jgi:phenylacetate-CoA ligase